MCWSEFEPSIMVVHHRNKVIEPKSQNEKEILLTVVPVSSETEVVHLRGYDELGIMKTFLLGVKQVEDSAVRFPLFYISFFVLPPSFPPLFLHSTSLNTCASFVISF